MLHKSTEKRNAKAVILKIILQYNFPAKPLPAQYWMPELEYLLIYSQTRGCLFNGCIIYRIVIVAARDHPFNYCEPSRSYSRGKAPVN
jgi:hypothetical protein